MYDVTRRHITLYPLLESSHFPRIAQVSPGYPRTRRNALQFSGYARTSSTRIGLRNTARQLHVAPGRPEQLLSLRENV